MREMNKQSFASFAILDLETSNLPDERFNKVGITELSVFGCSANELKTAIRDSDGQVKLPRILHKLTLMINPRMRIDTSSEAVTGLDNFLLEKESSFNENVANTFNGFLQHLQQPICLVAHNGFYFDFPVIKYVMERIKMTMPHGLYCVDSLRAFHDIDLLREERFEIELDANAVTNKIADNLSKKTSLETVLCFEKEYDAQALNETTPKRPIVNEIQSTILKRKRSASFGQKEYTEKPFKSRRCLNFDGSIKSSLLSTAKRPPGQRWYPRPAGAYTLPNLYKRVFKNDPVQAHYAEADVVSLTKLMLFYGQDFVNYAESYAILFSEIPKLGRTFQL